MTDITQDRVPTKMCGERVGDPLAEGAIIPCGALFVLNEEGLAAPAEASARGPVRGMALRRADQTDGDTHVEGASKGVYLFQNSEANPITAADIGLSAAVEDCHTVCKGSGCVAGVVFGVSDEGVWIELGRQL